MCTDEEYQSEILFADDLQNINILYYILNQFGLNILHIFGYYRTWYQMKPYNVLLCEFLIQHCVHQLPTLTLSMRQVVVAIQT